MSNKNNTAKRVFGIIFDLIFLAFTVFCVLTLGIRTMQKDSPNRVATVLNTSSFVLTNNYMEKNDKVDVSNYNIKNLNMDTLVVVNNIPEKEVSKNNWLKNVKQGDVLAIKNDKGVVEAIRVNQVDNEKIVLKYDNVADDNKNKEVIINLSKANSVNKILGKVTGQSDAIGSYITLISKPIYMILTVIMPAVIIFIVEAIRVLVMHNKNKSQMLAEAISNSIQELK